MNVVTSQETRRTAQGRNNKGVFKEAATRWGGGWGKLGCVSQMLSGDLGTFGCAG